MQYADESGQFSREVTETQRMSKEEMMEYVEEVSENGQTRPNGSANKGTEDNGTSKLL